MLKFLMDRLALSRKGAGDFVKGTFFTLLLDFALMLPAVYVFLFLDEYLRPLTGEAGVPGNDIRYYIAIAVLFIIVTWVIARLQYRSTYTTIYEESANRRLALAEKLRKLPLSFFAEKNLSDLSSTIMQDNTELEHTFSHAVPQLFASVIFLTIMGIMVFVYNWMLALALLWPAPLALVVILLSKKMQRKNQKNVYDQSRNVSEHIQEGLDTIQEIKAYSNEEKYLRDLDRKLDNYERSLISGELVIGLLVNSSKGLLKLGLVSVILVGAGLLVAGSVDLFTYLVFLILATLIFEPINEVFNNLAVLFYLDVRINRMREMEALPVYTGRTEFSPENFDIGFDHVDFSYETGKQVLRDVSFIAKQGEITALVGPSGGGKSTSAKLAARFWDVNSGRILLGNQDIKEIDPETLLKYYSVVFQDVVLFNTSVMENIRIGRHGASDEEVLRVAGLAQCDEFVNKLPDGYQTVIGENGEKLSGGERQRISIARALLKDAPIVLLDEATASLDVENETRIQAGISELVRNKTVLVIAHRMRTVATADKIVVLENGMVKESGRPEELKSMNGIFAGMVRRQMEMTGGKAAG
ncbi:ABC transporter related protein [Methanolacinia petrolearia DSM 11571]|uniref:ABC transporter related protein n=1 Tax=Methanolacinia petrolearia (strain DSM 11571 / OCM 486 / SEBR 4847) TaxID=679926 RepID=E1RH00_METP4|nr:ABC transporter ATP-binding protein [Methanolacinia petrolearia]ADN35224.1 ABC transporter related protein [Methanolacinia petrolearia DSM 11571]